MLNSRVNPHRTAAVPYGGSVPAVQRALAAIERLQSAPTGLSLTQLSRDLEISSSSLLAILRTLQGSEYVARDPKTHRYRTGPALAQCASSGHGGAEVWRVAEAVSALAQATLMADDGHDDPRAASTHREVLAALGQAAQHLATLLLDGSEGQRPLEQSEDVWRAGASGPLTAAELDHFLDGDCLATLSCVKDDGYPYSVPVWYQWADSRFWLVPRTRAAWAGYVTLNPRVSLAISEHQPPLRRVLVEGRMAPVSEPGSTRQARNLVAAMAHRYLGTTADAYLSSELAQPRQLFAISPEKLVTWRGLAPHPRYHSPQRPVAVTGGGIA